MNFDTLGLSSQVISSLKEIGFKEPTPIQAQTIPVACAGSDVLGSAQTGTGKTAAFVIPLVEKILSTKGNALILAPTRELAAQVMKSLKGFLKGELAKQAALLIGGESIFKQLNQLNKSTRIVVATPGRLMDHVRRKSVFLDKTDFIVLDEMDRMLDMGFMVQIDEIMAYLPKTRQTLLFSATIPQNIENISKKYMKDPVRVAIGNTFAPALNVKQEVIKIADSQKYNQLLIELGHRDGSIIVFVKTKINADKLAGNLLGDGHLVEAIHGDLRHQKREKVIKRFHQKKYRVLVATDIAARGLDIPHIEHVINYDLPQSPEDYIHRIGRTARAGNSGSAMCFVSPSDSRKWSAINKMLGGGNIDPDNRDKPAPKKSLYASPKKRGGGYFADRKPQKGRDKRFSDRRYNEDKSKSDRKNFDTESSTARNGALKISDDKVFKKKRVDGDFGKFSSAKKPFNRNKDGFSDKNRDGEGKKKNFSSFSKQYSGVKSGDKMLDKPYRNSAHKTGERKLAAGNAQFKRNKNENKSSSRKILSISAK